MYFIAEKNQFLQQFQRRGIMFFNDYSQFLDQDYDSNNFISSSKDKTYVQNPKMFYPQVPVQTTNDYAYTEFSQIIAKRLYRTDYPLNFQNTNPFCPVCLKFVKNGDSFMGCYIAQEKNYLIHQECLINNPAYELSHVEEEKTQTQTIVQKKMNSHEFSGELGLDHRDFLLELSLCHPISEQSFMKINKKCNLIRDHFKVSLKEDDAENYFPNILCFPSTDFNLVVTLSEFGKIANKTKFTKYINLKNPKAEMNGNYTINCGEVKLDVTFLTNPEEIMKLIEQMNYNYKYTANLNLSIVRIKHFMINLPEEFEESEEDEFIVESSSTIVEDLLNEKEEPEASTIKSSDYNYHLSNVSRNNRINSDSNSDEKDYSLNEREKVNLEKLIKTDKLIEYVKSNTQSRLFQAYLGEATPEEVNRIIDHIEPELPDLIMHQYGNYMAQKLFSVCSLVQRLRILMLLANHIPQISQNKQGTHTLQAFIALFTSQEEFTILSQCLKRDFYELSCHSNATHFLQKIIKLFSIRYTSEFFIFTADNLLAFALDKNAMCVIKHMIRKLKELQETQDNHIPIVEYIRKQFIKNVTFAVDQLISDNYGNYVIQFCYELFDLEKCSGITERILGRFPEYAMSKFSSNVIFKCISCYWTDKNILQNLKFVLNYNNVHDIYKNKDGNKVLLEIMQKFEGTEVWEKLYGILIQVEPTKFYHDRWGMCLGSRSGQVGYKLNSFPEAKKKYKNSNNNRRDRDRY